MQEIGKGIATVAIWFSWPIMFALMMKWTKDKSSVDLDFFGLLMMLFLQVVATGLVWGRL